MLERGKNLISNILSDGLRRAFRLRVLFYLPFLILVGGILIEEFIENYNINVAVFWTVVGLVVLFVVLFPLGKKSRFKYEYEYLERLLTLMSVDSSDRETNRYVRVRAIRFCKEYGLIYPPRSAEVRDIWLIYLDAMIYCAENGDLERARTLARNIVRKGSEPRI